MLGRFALLLEVARILRSIGKSVKPFLKILYISMLWRGFRHKHQLNFVIPVKILTRF